MKIEVKVIPNAKNNLIKEDSSVLKVYITAPAVDGKANKAIIPFLAKHFSVRKSQIEIIKPISKIYLFSDSF